MSNNELYEHKRSDTVKWVLTLFAFILVGVMLAGIILGWFDKKEEPPAGEEQQQTEDGGMVVGEAEGIEMRVMSAKISPANYEEYGISPMAESAQRLTATIMPANATNQEVDWAVVWVNPSSSWASGKTVTDYVTVTPTSDGALTANVECLQAFGEQVKVTCTSRQNPEASAGSKVDYIKRIISGTMNYLGDKTGSVNFTSEGSTYTYTATSNVEEIYIDSNDSVFTPVTGVGTLDDEYTYDITVTMNGDWAQALYEGGFYASYIDSNYIKDLSEISMLQIGSFIGGNILTYEAQDMVYDDAYTGSSGAFNGLSSALRNFGTAELFTVEVVATGQYSTFTGSCTFSCDASGFQILVESVGGLGNLVF